MSTSGVGRSDCSAARVGIMGESEKNMADKLTENILWGPDRHRASARDEQRVIDFPHVLGRHGTAETAVEPAERPDTRWGGFLPDSIGAVAAHLDAAA